MDLNTAIKCSIKGYVENLNISNFMFATYTGGGIKIDNKPKTIPLEFAVVPKHLTDYNIDMVINGTTQNVTVKNKLVVGDRLIVGQATGAQKYFIIDRV